MGRKLNLAEYADLSPVQMTHFFLGKKLCVQTSEGYADGLIYEAEAYGGAEDAACHGYRNRRTQRTEILFGPGGVAYVYLCYGLHDLFNIVIGHEGSPEAVLIRAVWITSGHALVQKRRGHLPEKLWANGPGKVCAALGINRNHNGCALTGKTIWIEDCGFIVPADEVQKTPRIGVAYAGKIWAKKPWRLVWKRKPDQIS